MAGLETLRETFEKQAREERGLLTFSVEDEPGTTYPLHAHGRVDILTLTGSAELRLGDNGPWFPVCAGEVTVIEAGEKHQAVAGLDGWSYILACTEEEARTQGLLTE